MALLGFPLFPPSASLGAPQVDLLFFAWLGLAGTTSLAIALLIVFFAIKYRRGSQADRTPQRLPTNAIEWTWTVIPLGLFLGMFSWAAWLYYQDFNPPKDALEIDVVGKQWMWKIQHLTGQRELNELHVPLGWPVKLVMTSQDVIHSFYIPAFRIKQDVVPGRYTAEWFQPTVAGEFHLYCSEYCGTDHANMNGRVIVQAPADYARWLAGHRTPDTMVGRGAALFRAHGCTGCHGTGAVVHAPRLEGVYGHTQPLEGGGFVLADEGYLRDSILLPAKQVVAGYPAIMPSFKGQLSEDELLDMLAYLKSLEKKAP